MAEDSAGSGLSKKLGPLPVWGWGAASAAAYLVFRYYKSRSAAASTAGSSIPVTTSQPIDTGTGGSGSGSGLPIFNSVGAWINAAITKMSGSGVGAGDAYNGVNAWLAGSCVDQAVYNALSSALTALGTPPGFAQGPALTVCPTSTGTTVAQAGPQLTTEQFLQGIAALPPAQKTATEQFLQWNQAQRLAGQPYYTGLTGTNGQPIIAQGTAS